MRRVFAFGIILILLSLNIAAQTNSSTSSQPVPDGFESDGCSRFPDGSYRDCCVAHDVKYYYGGSWRDRWRADNELRKCVANKPGFEHKPLSVLMWLGVRTFGVPWLHTSFRWGFGKDKVAGTPK